MDAIIICLLFATFAASITGLYFGVKAGKRRTQTLISYLVDTMEELRDSSKVKASNKNKALNEGRLDEAKKLEIELSAESRIFYEIQHVISDWCINREEKDPFAL